MKNISIALTLGILLISSALLVSIPKNVIAQQEDEDVDYTMTEEQIKAKITDFKTKHPKYATIAEQLPTLDLKETAKAYIAAGTVEKLLKQHIENLSDVSNMTSSESEEEMTDAQFQALITHIKTNHPRFAAVVEDLSNRDLETTFNGVIGALILEKLLINHAKNLIEEKIAAATP